jgi:hypothetical protein
VECILCCGDTDRADGTESNIGKALKNFISLSFAITTNQTVCLKLRASYSLAILPKSDFVLPR